MCPILRPGDASLRAHERGGADRRARQLPDVGGEAVRPSQSRPQQTRGRWRSGQRDPPQRERCQLRARQRPVQHLLQRSRPHLHRGPSQPENLRAGQNGGLGQPARSSTRGHLQKTHVQLHAKGGVRVQNGESE